MTLTLIFEKNIYLKLFFFLVLGSSRPFYNIFEWVNNHLKIKILLIEEQKIKLLEIVFFLILIDILTMFECFSANCLSVGEELIFIGCADGIVRCFSPHSLQVYSCTNCTIYKIYKIYTMYTKYTKYTMYKIYKVYKIYRTYKTFLLLTVTCG